MPSIPYVVRYKQPLGGDYIWTDVCDPADLADLVTALLASYGAGCIVSVLPQNA